MDLMQKNWFTEACELWPGQRFSMKVDQVLHHEKSDFQDILFLKTETYGRCLVLDGIIQCTERDEFCYQEMLTFLALNSHKNPKKVLIVGGGDGGVAREVVKHPNVLEVHQVEIDGRVVDLSKKHLPFMAKGFESPKFHLHIADGFKFMEEHSNEFDVIITDSSDPIGPATNLFTADYFFKLKHALKADGIISTQASNPFLGTKEVRENMDGARKAFKNVSYGMSMVPSYPSGQIGYILATNDANVKFEPQIKFTEQQLDDMNLRYYDASVHTGSLQLPRFIRKALFE